MEKAPCRCAVRGSINHDEYFYVKSIARPGETISSYRHESRVGGKGANQAIAITRAGGTADFYGTVGHDGLWIKEKVATFGLDDSGILVADVPTGRALIQLADSGENSIILFRGANHSVLQEKRWTSRSPDKVFPGASHLLLQNEIPIESTLYALNNSEDVTIIFNPSPLPTSDQIDSFPWHKVDWLLVNEGEALDLYDALVHKDRNKGTPGTLSPVHELIANLSDQPPLSNTNIVCTLGKDGVLAVIPTLHKRNSAHASPLFMSFPAAELQGTTRDTTGAGDCFTGYFVAGLMEFGARAEVGREIQEEDMARILKTCVQAAGMCVEKQGTIDSVPSRDEVEVRMSTN